MKMSGYGLLATYLEYPLKAGHTREVPVRLLLRESGHSKMER